jgi:hypothetical protein
VIADATPGERGPRLVAARLDLLRDADPDPLARCTRALVPVLLRLAGEERLDACRRLLDLLSGWPRLQALQAVYNTAPLIAAAGGPDAATDTFDALLDVMRWWPSLARLPTAT